MAKPDTIAAPATDVVVEPKTSEYLTLRAGLRWKGQDYEANATITLPTIIGSKLVDKGAVKPA